MAGKVQYFRQVAISKGNRQMVCWLPLEFCKKGKVLELQEGGTWSNGWVVRSIYKATLTEKELIERSRDWTRTREASDV